MGPDLSRFGLLRPGWLSLGPVILVVHGTRFGTRLLTIEHQLRAASGPNNRGSDTLIDAIKSYGYYGKLTLWTWIVVTSDSASDVFGRLRPHIDRHGRLFVGPLAKSAVWINLTCGNEWMHDRP